MSEKLATLAVIAAGGLLASLLKEDRCDSGALQSYFNKLHDDIKLGNVDENALLREKRDLLIQELREKTAGKLPPWSSFNQGSYAMGTGINPPDRDFDIDVGIVFECTRTGVRDPVGLKREICTALAKGNRTVLIRRPCVTVQYLREGAVDYHVDLAIYVRRADSQTLDLAMGKLHSAASYRHWSEQDPQGLIDKIKTRFSGSNAEQFRRCIRYIKRWRNAQFKNGGAPLSIALTCATYAWFEPYGNDFLETGANDAKALAKLTEAVLENITTKPEILLPAAPRVNLLEKMTARQISFFIEKLAELRKALDTAMSLPVSKLNEAHEILNAQFLS